ncbi:ATP-dependent DNA helicase [Candidatus Woesearchaeota archaeon]|jgi:DNA excision repair protein ERCC-2|nr:ATP-dependent DNA helicase [Candidatus Woesearchaeota archaeon]
MFSDEKKKEWFFPHEEVRKIQEKLIEDISKALGEGKKIITHAPTGLGKTASVLGPALRHAMNKDKVVFFLTNRHTQHQIAIETLKKIKEKWGGEFGVADIIGKRWMCNQEVAGLFGSEFNEFCKAVVEKRECEFYNNVKDKTNFTVEAKGLIEELGRRGPLHNEELKRICESKHMCSYEIAMGLAKKAKVIIGDYNYCFDPFVQSNLFRKIEKEMEDVILIVDEAHNLPGRVVDMMSHNLTNNMLKNAILEAKKFGFDKEIDWLQEIQKVLLELSDGLGREGEEKVDKKSFFDRVNKFRDYDLLVEELEEVANEIRKKQRKSFIGGVAYFLESWQGEDEGFVRYVSEKEGKYGKVVMISYSCLDPSLITRTVFERVHSAVLMSGTLRPTFMYNDILGVEGEEKEYGSPFPVENKLNLIVPETSTKFNLRGEGMYQRIAGHCSRIAELVPGNVALFFPSYKLRNSVCSYLKSEKKLFWEKQEMGKENKEAFLADFKMAKREGGVLLGVLGGSFAEGVDFPGDLLNCVVVVGLPLARPDLKTKEVMKYFENKFGKGWEYGYIYPAMNKCFQSAGRCIRSEHDKGAVIYLEERFTWPMYFGSFPKEGLIVSKEYEQLLEEFFA